MGTTVIAVSSSYASATLKEAISGNVTILMISVLVLIVVITGYLLLRRRK